MQTTAFFHLCSKVNRIVELLLITRWSPAKEFAFKLRLCTGSVLEDTHDALLILFCFSVCKQLRAIRRDVMVMVCFVSSRTVASSNDF